MKQPKFVLVIAQMHQKHPECAVSSDWKQFQLNRRQFLAPVVKTEQIAENIWQIPLDSDLLFFASLIQQMRDFHIPIRVLFFEDKPEWKDSPPSA
jgi:hypothetical protein